jgi:hypothetical protein
MITPVPMLRPGRLRCVTLVTPEGASPTANLPAGTGQTPRRSRAGTVLVGAGTALVPEIGSRPEDFCPERLNVGGSNKYRPVNTSAATCVSFIFCASTMLPSPLVLPCRQGRQ